MPEYAISSTIFSTAPFLALPRIVSSGGILAAGFSCKRERNKEKTNYAAWELIFQKIIYFCK